MDLIAAAKGVLATNMGLRPGERLLVLCDSTTEKIGASLFEAGQELGAKALKIHMAPLERNGMEPDEAVVFAMERADVVVAPLGASITHTQARQRAAAAGARIATMPRITEDMFFQGPITADYDQVAELTLKVTALLDRAQEAELITGPEGQYRLTMSLQGRKGVASTGVYRERGQSGNLPSGEGYIAPLEGTAQGQAWIDGSFVGFGILASPLLLTFEKGLLVRAEGAQAEALEKMLGPDSRARNLAELGIGTNHKARVTGVILEDEKIYGTVHIALGSNDTFGGAVAAGIHVDGVMRRPLLKLDGRVLVSGGQVVLSD